MYIIKRELTNRCSGLGWPCTHPSNWAVTGSYPTQNGDNTCFHSMMYWEPAYRRCEFASIHFLVFAFATDIAMYLCEVHKDIRKRNFQRTLICNCGHRKYSNQVLKTHWDIRTSFVCRRHINWRHNNSTTKKCLLRGVRQRFTISICRVNILLTDNGRGNKLKVHTLFILDF